MIAMTYIHSICKIYVCCRNVNCDWKFCQIQNALLSDIVDKDENPQPAETIILGENYSHLCADPPL